MLPPPALWTHCGHTMQLIEGTCTYLHVGEASAQAGPTYEWLPFISRDYLRDAMA